MKKYLLTGAVVVCAALFVLAVANMYARWQRDQYFGEIIRASANEFVLEDVRVGERLVRISPTTEIRRGRDTQQMLLVGDRIIVFGVETGGVIQATSVRVVENSKWGKEAIVPR